jgi:hypothetical protein
MTWISDYALGSVLRDHRGRWFKVALHQAGKGFSVLQPCDAKGEPNGKPPEAFKADGAWVTYYKARAHESMTDMDGRVEKAAREYDTRDPSHINPDDDDNLTSNGQVAVAHAPPPVVAGSTAAAPVATGAEEDAVVEAAKEGAKKKARVVIPGTDPENPLCW